MSVGREGGTALSLVPGSKGAAPSPEWPREAGPLGKSEGWAVGEAALVLGAERVCVSEPGKNSESRWDSVGRRSAPRVVPPGPGTLHPCRTEQPQREGSQVQFGAAEAGVGGGRLLICARSRDPSLRSLYILEFLVLSGF